MNVSFEEFDKAALKCHGYLLSDEDCTTDTDDETNCGDLEFYKRYKPPPLIIPRENIVVIKAAEPNQTNQNGLYLLQNKHAFEKKKERSLPQKPRRTIDDNCIITRNFFKVLELSDGSSEEEIEHIERIDIDASSAPAVKLREEELATKNERTARISAGELPNRKIKTDRKQKAKHKKQLKEPPISREYRRSLCTFVRYSSSPDGHSRKKKVITKFETNNVKIKTPRGEDYNLPDEDIDLFTFYQPCLLWSAFLENEWNLVEPVSSELRTSWDYISTNNIYHSDKLIEQEYDNIIGSKKTLTEPPAKSSPLTFVKKFFNEIDYAECLTVVGAVIAAYVCTRINK